MSLAGIERGMMLLCSMCSNHSATRALLYMLFRCVSLCAFLSYLCLSLCPCPWTELRGHLEDEGSYLNHVCECYYVCVWISWRCKEQIYTPCAGDMKAISQAAHFSLFCVSLAAWLELVQFNFFRAHRLVLSPLYPFFSLPMGETYFHTFFLL